VKVDSKLRDAVRERANGRCEYCRLPEVATELAFQVDHIIAEKHRGPTVLENLALACAYCNRFKGTNLSGVDPDTGSMTRLYRPRDDRWNDHFAWAGPEVLGLTAIGRTTIEVLRINHPEAVELRSILTRLGEFCL